MSARRKPDPISPNDLPSPEIMLRELVRLQEEALDATMNLAREMGMILSPSVEAPHDAEPVKIEL